MSKSAALTDWVGLAGLYPRYLGGDGAAARALFGGILPVLAGYFRARIGAKAEVDDLVQASLLKIHFARDRFDERQSLKTWVFTIASRTLIDHWRGAAVEAEAFAPDRLASGDDADGVQAVDFAKDESLSPELKAQLQGDLLSALAGLKPIDRSIVYLAGVEGMSMAEIARVHELTEGATKLRAHRAYKELRKILAALVLAAALADLLAKAGPWTL